MGKSRFIVVSTQNSLFLYYLLYNYCFVLTVKLLLPILAFYYKSNSSRADESQYCARTWLSLMWAHQSVHLPRTPVSEGVGVGERVRVCVCWGSVHQEDDEGGGS